MIDTLFDALLNLGIIGFIISLVMTIVIFIIAIKVFITIFKEFKE